MAHRGKKINRDNMGPNKAKKGVHPKGGEHRDTHVQQSRAGVWASKSALDYRPEYFTNSVRLISFKFKWDQFEPHSAHLDWDRLTAPVSLSGCKFEREGKYNLYFQHYPYGQGWQSSKVQNSTNELDALIQKAQEVLAQLTYTRSVEKMWAPQQKVKEIFNKGVHKFVLEFFASKQDVIKQAWRIKGESELVHDYVIVLHDNTLEVRADFYEFLEQFEDKQTFGETKVDFHFFTAENQNALNVETLEPLPLPAA